MSFASAPLPGASVAGLGAALRRRWTWVVGATLIGLAIGLVAGGLIARTYSSSATVTINPITSTLFAVGPLSQQVNTATEAEVMASGQVRALASERLADGTTPQQLGQALTVSIPTESLALTATTTGADGPEAARRADAVADAYLAFRRAQAESQAKVFLDKVDDRIAQLEKTLKSKPANSASLSAELTSLRRDQSEALTLVVNPGSVIERAVVPPGPSVPRLITLAAAGAAFGFLVGVGLVWWRMRREGLIETVEEIATVHPAREAAIREAISLPAGVLADGPWSDGARQDVLALRVALARMGPDPIVVLGPAEAAAFARQLAAATAELPADGNFSRAAVSDHTGAERGTAAVAAAQAGVVVVTAVRGSTSRDDLSDAVSQALGVTATSTSLVDVLIDVH